MDYVTRQFINLTKKFRKELRLLVSKLNSALDKQTEAIRETNQTANTKESVPPEVITHVHLPESIEVHKRASDASDDKKYQRRTLFVSSVTFAVLFGYTIIVYFQWREMINATGVSQQAVIEARRNRIQAEKSLNATIEQFHLEQRAWITVASIKLNILAEDQPISIRLNVANTGKIPAILTTARYTIRINPTIDFPDTAGYKPVPSGAMVTPGIPIAADCTGHKLVQAEVNAIKTSSAFLYIYGYFNYRDAFRNDRTTGYCGLYNPKSDEFFQPTECNQRNYAD